MMALRQNRLWKSLMIISGAYKFFEDRRKMQSSNFFTVIMQIIHTYALHPPDNPDQTQLLHPGKLRLPDPKKFF